MSRYYDPVTHRFVNADGYFQSGQDILDANMSAYCRNNPVNCYDPTGTKCSKHDPYYVSNCFTCNPDYAKFEKENPEFLARSKRAGNFEPRKDKKKGSDQRQPTGNRERNVGHPNGEEHSRVPKGNGIRRVEEVSFLERVSSAGMVLVSGVSIVYLVANDVSGIGVADDAALVPAFSLFWDSLSKVVG